MFGKKIAAVLVMTMAALMLSAPAMAGAAEQKSGNGPSQAPAAVGSAPTLIDSIAAALPVHLGAFVKAAFGPEKKSDDGLDQTTSGLGGCRLLICVCGLGGC